MAVRTEKQDRVTDGNPGKGMATSAVMKQDEGICVEHYVTIDRSAHDLYIFWRDFENLPMLMKHLKSVKVLDGKRSHWVVDAPGGPVEWDAEIINEIPDRLIGWRSVEGTKVPNAGSVRTM